ncbi:GDP-mannose 4,6-dehydratase [bacterium]|nr:GDP-mannose 4,6-dehydratase [bacterium]
MKNILITGITGSGASYLAEHLCDIYPDAEIHGITRWHSTTGPNNLVDILHRVQLHECDLCDFSSVMRALIAAKPTHIFHLASHANVRAGFTTPLSVIQNNIMGTANLFEAVRLADIDPAIQLCSTSEVYGQVDPKNVPINEDCPQKPSSPYAVSKTAQDHLGYTYFKSYGLKIVTTRMFAYFNPRRADLFSTSFARQVALIEAGKQEKLFHGNLDSVRTLIDVRDAMEAYRLAILKCRPGEAYNIGGQTTISVGDFLEVLKKKAKVNIVSEVDPALLRPSDVTLQIPDCSKFATDTGWTSKHDFEESVEHLLGAMRSRL